MVTSRPLTKKFESMTRFSANSVQKHLNASFNQRDDIITHVIPGKVHESVQSLKSPSSPLQTRLISASKMRMVEKESVAQSSASHHATSIERKRH